MNTVRIRTIAASLLLGISYLALIFQWLWMLLIAVPPLIKSGALDGLQPATEQAPVIHAEPMAASPLVWTIIGIITLVILIATAVILISLPKTIVQTSERVVHQAAEAVIPVITHHKAIPAKKRLLLSRRLTLALQLLVAFIPLVVSFFLPPLGELSPRIIMTIAGLLAIISMAGFAIAWLLQPQSKTTSRTRSHASRG